MEENMKYFYKCPLAAAWMAKHFGMEFLNASYIPAMKYSGGRGFITEYGDLHQSGFFWNNKDCESGKIYIKLKSFPILNPHPADIIITRGSIAVATIAYWAENAVDVNILGELNSGNPFDPTMKIIQRNGIAFHWPESEAELAKEEADRWIQPMK